MDQRLFAALVIALLVTTGCQPQPIPLPTLPPSLSPATGYSADCPAVSATLTLRPNQTGSFQVMCTNTGTITWVRGTPTEAVLATCCPVGTNVTFSTWGMSGGRYASQNTNSVSPGAILTVSFNLTVPSSTPGGTYTSHGALVDASNRPISAQVLAFTVTVP